ncbi:MAG: hypothetical protein IPH89_04285 [Bacteroidetes bacterium]|nr:hypothetical protein [Bacteroidota bacterium]
MNQEFYRALETQVDGAMPRLGDLYYEMKNTSVGTSLNSRNFTLIGDPALRLAYPKHKISTDSINAVAVTAFRWIRFERYLPLRLAVCKR